MAGRFRLIRVLVSLAVIGAACGVLRATAPAPSPGPRIHPRPEAPCTIRPTRSWPEVASPDELRAILTRVEPPAEPNTNNWVHALRLWGPEITFPASGRPSGTELLAFLTDDATFRRLAGDDAPPLVAREQGVPVVRAYEVDGPAPRLASVHPDDLLATFAEVGLPPATPLLLREGSTTVEELLDAALARYHLEQMEYEWTAIFFARYVFPQPSWRNRYGQEIRLNDLLGELIDLPARQGVCGGTHRLEALVLLLRADEQVGEQVGGLSRRQRRRIAEHLLATSRQLTASQHPEGYWTKDWSAAPDPSREAAPLADRILATGHHLEWLALAPDELLPPRETILRAARWLVRALVEVDDATIAREYGPFSHAARALCLWRGAEAGAVRLALDRATASVPPGQE